jgi:ABC-type sugar transport system ATPase subunit
MTKIACTDVGKRFIEPDGSSVAAVSGVTLETIAGQVTVIVGANGSGKSTLLRLLGGELTPDAGAIAFIDKSGRSQKSARARARMTTWIAQNPALGSVSEFSVLENLRLATLPAAASPFAPAVNGAVRSDTARALTGSPLLDKVTTSARNLSQGQRQLLAIEMAMLQRPSVLLADEPTASLDRRHGELCFDRLTDLARNGANVVIVTHDLAAAARVGDRVVVMRDGAVHAELSGTDKDKSTVNDLVELGGFLGRGPPDNSA